MFRITAAALALLMCALGASGVVYGASTVFHVDSDLTSARFAVVQLGISKAEGRLGRTSGTIHMDGQHRVESVNFEIDTQAVDSGWKLRDAFLKSELMFDTARYPRIRFRSNRVVYEGARFAAVEGDVTLRGVTRPVRFEVNRFECAVRADDAGETCGAEVVARISRGAFGMDFAYPLISDEVEIAFVVKASGGPDAPEVKKP